MKIKKELVKRDIAGDIVLVPVGKTVYEANGLFVLNEVGAFLWDRLPEAEGAEDLTADLRCQRTKEGREIDYARQRMVVAARAAGVDVYDTPFTDVNDDEGIVVDATYAKSLGFTGKASISPRHIDAINTVFSPTKKEIAYAYEVMEAIALAKQQGKGAIALRGKMIDAPIVNRAQQTIAAAEALGIRKEDLV